MSGLLAYAGEVETEPFPCETHDLVQRPRLLEQMGRPRDNFQTIDCHHFFLSLAIQLQQ